jgi:ADP-ribose pyrophosphatase YjhB (NUDIX family)
VAFCFDGQNLRVLTVSGRNGTPALPTRPYAASSGIERVAREVLESHGLRSFRPVQHVDAFELPSEVDAPFVAATDLELVTLAVCGPLSSIAHGNSPSHQEALLGEGLAWTPLAHCQSGSAGMRSRVDRALSSLRQKARFEDVAFSLLAEEFSLSELQRVFEAVLGKTIDVRNFRKKIDALDILSESPNKPRGMAYRPPRLFRFDAQRFDNRMSVDGEIRFF